MYIYHSQLSKGTSYIHAVAGSFSGSRNFAEIIVSRNRVLELYSVNNQGQLSIHCSQYFHFTIRSLAVLNWLNRDFVVIASDSGQVFLLCYSPENNGFLPILKKTHGMPVTLPELPGHFIATSCGAFAIGSLAENFKFYSLAVEDVRNNDSGLSISQPRCIIYDFIGIPKRTPTFASLEVLCDENEEDPGKMKQYLKIYEANFKNKDVVTHSYVLPYHGNKLIYVPEEENHPDGLLVCYEDILTFHPLKAGYKEIECYLPQRNNDAFNSKKGFILVSSTIYRMKGYNVVLGQTEQGDLFAIRIEQHDEQELVMNIRYIDTIPVASSMCMVVGSILFIAAEFGDNFLYKVKSLGEEREMIPFKFEDRLVSFNARKLKNLSILGCLKSISPVMQAQVLDTACNNLKQFAFACGHRESSTLRLQRYGIKVSTMYHGTLPFFPISVWSVNTEIEGQRITYIIFSHMSSTIVLTLDKLLVVDCDTAINYKLPTLDCAQCTQDSFIQVYHKGFRVIRNNQFTEYKVKRDILQCAIHLKQIALALVNNEGMYFEIEYIDGQINFKQMQNNKFSFMSIVLCMQFIPRENKAKHLAVCLDSCFKLYSVDIMGMECLTTFNLDHIPESIAIVSCEEGQTMFNSIINIGYQDGFLQRIAVNEQVIESEYSMKLGTKPVKLCVGKFNNNVAVLALSNRAWISFYDQKRMLSLAPLDFKEEIYSVAFLSAVASPKSNIVALSNTDLYLLSVDHYESLIEDAVVRLSYTPNMFVTDSKSNFLIISESDRRPQFHKEREITPQKAMDLSLYPPKSPPKTEQKGKRLAAVWDSLLHIFDPIEKKTLFQQPLPNNMTVVSMTLVQFGAENPQYLLVGVKQQFSIQCLQPKKLIYIYELSEDGKSFSLVNTTVVEDVPSTICQIEDYILIGIGNLLCLYTFKQSTKDLIRCAVEELVSPVLAVWSRGNFFIVKTANERITYGCLEVEEVSLIMIHEDRYMRGVTCLCFWDDDIIFVANKRSISAVFLPYYGRCEKRPEQTEADISELTERMDISDPGSSVSRPDKSSLELDDLNFSKGLSSFQERQSASKVETSTEVKPLFKMKLSAEKSGESPEPKAGPSHSVPKSSVSKTKTSKTAVLTSPSGSSSTELDYCHPFARFLYHSYTLVTYEVGEYVRSIQRTSLIEDGRDLIVYTTMSGMVGTLVPFLCETHPKVFGLLEYLIAKSNPFLSTEWLAPTNPSGTDIHEQCYDDQVVVDANVCELFSLLKRQHQLEIANKLGISVLEVLQKIEELKRTKYF